MGATDVVKYIVIGAAAIAVLFALITIFFSVRYKKEIIQAERRRSARIRQRVASTPPESHSAEREVANVG
jgi:heme exporter protein D